MKRGWKKAKKIKLTRGRKEEDKKRRLERERKQKSEEGTNRRKKIGGESETLKIITFIALRRKYVVYVQVRNCFAQSYSN